MNTLELRDVVKHYAIGGEVVRAADGVSLTVGPGAVVSIYGPSDEIAVANALRRLGEHLQALGAAKA